jgi:predicted PurR-regulated permease PerM
LTTAESTTRKRIGEMLSYAIVLLIAYLAYQVFEPFFVALAWAAVLVVVSYPAYDRLARRWRPSAAALVSTAGVTLVLIAPAVLILILFLRQGVEAIQSIHLQAASGRLQWLNDIWARLAQRFPELNSAEVASTLHRYGGEGAQFLAGRLGTVVRHTAEFLFDLVVTVFAMYYLFRDGGSLVARLRLLLPFQAIERERMIEDAREVILATVLSSFLAAAAHGAVIGLAFAVVGIRAALFWGVIMGFLSLIPVVGSSLIWVPASIGLMLEGHLLKGIVLGIFCIIIVGVIDNVLRPWFISGRAQMGQLLVFIGVLGGVSVFGALGIVLGPIVVALAANLLDLYSPRGERPGHTPPPPGANSSGVVLE